MIDIIIPAYNAHDTIIKTLSSIRLQTISHLVTVYIVDDCSKKGYKDEINLFKGELNIIELKTPHNMGPGGARQYAMDNSNGKYIMFIDADDQLYNAYVLNLLLFEIENNDLDAVNSGEKINNYIDRFLNNSLHGKIYRRSFLEEHNIRFNNTRYSEDNCFTRIVFGLSKKTKTLDVVTYLYNENSNSLTNLDYDKKREKILKYFLFNMIYVILDLKRRNPEGYYEYISSMILSWYIFVFAKIMYYDGEEHYKSIFFECYRFELLFREFEKEFSKENYIDCIAATFSISGVVAEKIYYEFFDFRKKFKVVE